MLDKKSNEGYKKMNDPFYKTNEVEKTYQKKVEAKKELKVTAFSMLGVTGLGIAGMALSVLTKSSPNIVPVMIGGLGAVGVTGSLSLIAGMVTSNLSESLYRAEKNMKEVYGSLNEEQKSLLLANRKDLPTAISAMREKYLLPNRLENINKNKIA